MSQAPKTMKDLSDPVLDFLNDLSGFEFNRKFMEKYGLDQAKTPDLINLVWDVVLGEAELSNLPRELEKRFGLPADKAQAAAIELAGARFLPIAREVGDVAWQITAWGGSLADFKDQKSVSLPELTAENFVAGALADLGVAMESEVLQHRLELILISYIKGVRAASEALDALTRAQKVGGLAMEKEDAEFMLKEMDEKLAFVKVSFKEGGEIASSFAKASEDKKETSSFAKTPDDNKAAGITKVQDVKPPLKKSNPQVQPVSVQPKNQQDQEINRLMEKMSAARAKTKELLFKLKEDSKRFSKPGSFLAKAPKDKAMDELFSQIASTRVKTREIINGLKKKPEIFEAKNRAPIPDLTVKDAKDAANHDLAVEKDLQKRKRQEQKDKLGRFGRPAKTQPARPENQKDPKRKITDSPILKNQAKAGLGADVFSEQDENEIKKIASLKIKPEESEPKEAEALTEAVIARSKLEIADLEMKKRLKGAVDSRRRDVRDIYEVRALLESAKEQGGLGLSGAELAQVVRAIDWEVSEYHARLKAGAEEKKQEALRQKRETQASAARALLETQAAAMAKRYAELTGQEPDENHRNASATEEGKQNSVGAIKPQEIKSAVLGARGLKRQAARLSAPSIPAPASGKSPVQDVRFTRRLAGPVEELRGLGLVEFRRLSLDPEAAIQKIKDKIALAEDQGFDQKIAAVKAWRSSPLHQQYLVLTRSALRLGKNVSEMLQEQKGDGLTPEELSAIMKLNSQLIF